MGRNEAHHAEATAEKIHGLHRALALGLGALAGLVLIARGPANERRASEDVSGEDRSGGAAVDRAELDAAISRLAAWLDRSSRAPRTMLETNQRLLALGRAALDADAAPIAASLERLLTPRGATPGPVPASLPTGGTKDGRDASAVATLAILLEAGTPLEREIPLRSGPTRLSQLLELALPEASQPASATDPWAMDLLSFALLAGMTEHRESLARRVHASLVELDREQRRLGAGPADDRAGAPEALQLGASVFRALAVLDEPELEQQGLRHLNALLHRYSIEREQWGERLGQARREPEQIALHLEAIEQLGQLEQTLFGADLAFRRGRSGEPAPRTASSMRRAASDLMAHLSALTRAGLFATETAADATPELRRAAARAVRGLRAARVAT